jgi:hypothetical protein
MLVDHPNFPPILSASPPDPAPDLSDIFSDSPPQSPSANSTHPSDIECLRSTHSTAGYREGVSASKTKALQPGFDEGYTLGAVLGLRVGKILGILHGVCEALKDTDEEYKQKYENMRSRAIQELKFENIFAKEWWGEDGVWKWDVLVKSPLPKQEVESERNEVETFVDVADSHPIIKTWFELLSGLIKELDVNKTAFLGAEWEAGRIS